MPAPPRKCHLHVVEEHHHAFWWLCRAVGSKQLPFQGRCVLLHLDAHPDLQLPAGDLFPADLAPEQWRVLFERLSIGDWILPAVFAGHIGDIVWLRPAWARQLTTEDCDLVCCLGVDRRGVLKVDCCSVYYLSEGSYCRRDQLTCCCEFRVLVRTLHQHTDAVQLAAELDSLLAESPYVLDVDLDFFSTSHPFLDSLPAEVGGYEALVRIFGISVKDGSPESIMQARRSALKCAAGLFDWLQCADKATRCGSWLCQSDSQSSDNADRHSEPSSLCASPAIGKCRVCTELWALVSRVNQMNADGGSVDWSEVLNAVSTIDSSGLPRHISSQNQIIHMLQQMECLLRNVTCPALITVARSCDDSYCPPDQVEFIQQQVIERLTGVCSSVHERTLVIHKHYLNEHE